MAPTVICEYQRQRTLRRTRLRRWMVIATVPVAALVFLSCHAPNLASQCRSVYWQKRAMIYDGGACVVFESDPGAAAQLVASGSGYRFPSRQLFNMTAPPADWRPSAYHMPVEYRGMFPDPFWGSAEGVAYLHERYAGDKVYIVTVTVGSSALNPDGSRAVGLSGCAFEPITWSFKPTLIEQRPKSREFLVRLSSGDRLTIFAGTTDAGDASRFSITYRLNDVNYDVSGRLCPDGSIWLEPRK